MKDLFRFRNFAIRQDKCAMKVGTDGVLIGAWADGGHRILDIGAGTGLIALMMAQRFPLAQVDAVEIDADAAGQARDNIQSSPFAERILVYPVALQDFNPSGKYDSIVTNPPFFKQGLSSPLKGRDVARRMENLPFSSIFSFVEKWLTEDGRFSAVIPLDSMDDFIAEASLHGLFLARQCKVRTTPVKPPKRVLISFSKSRPAEFRSEEQVLMDGDGKRSTWYQALTQDFYLW